MSDDATRRAALLGDSAFPHAAHQQIGHTTAEACLAILTAIHQRVHGGARGEAAPIVQGCVSALLQFMVQGDVSDDDIRFVIDREIDRILPQIRYAIAHGEAKGSA